jgi:hypothetical protein
VKAAEKVDEQVAQVKRHVVRRRTFRQDGTLRSDTVATTETGTVAETNRHTEATVDTARNTDESLRLGYEA